MCKSAQRFSIDDFPSFSEPQYEQQLCNTPLRENGNYRDREECAGISDTKVNVVLDPEDSKTWNAHWRSTLKVSISGQVERRWGNGKISAEPGTHSPQRYYNEG